MKYKSKLQKPKIAVLADFNNELLTFAFKLR